jgi:molybdopterin-guanine dinucleotide biosynthesis protein A
LDTPLVTGWVLSGGEGRRMGGQDKGLIPWQGHPMAWQVAQRLSPQVASLSINANRHLDQYRAWPWQVCPDQAELPTHFGPLVGILTGLRQARTPWLQLAPCDSPRLPTDLVARLLDAALTSGVDVAVPVTLDADQTERHHWTSALIRVTLADNLAQAVALGRPQVRGWMTQQHWTGVCFARDGEFANINTPGDLA